MDMQKRYRIYVELNEQYHKTIAETDSAEVADSVYGMYISQLKNGLTRYGTDNITKVGILRKQDGAQFSFSVTEGFKETFKKTA